MIWAAWALVFTLAGDGGPIWIPFETKELCQRAVQEVQMNVPYVRRSPICVQLVKDAK